MTEERYSTQNMLVLRKLTRALADLLRGQLREYLGTLGPQLRPKSVFGDFVDSRRDSYQTPEPAFLELQSAYEAVANKKPFNLPKELQPPLEVVSAIPEITPVEYTHNAKTDKDSKTVKITVPFKWILTYTGFAPKRLQDLFAGRTTGNEVQEYVLHTLMMHVVLSRQPGLTRMLEGLHFPITTGRLPGFGELPITFISSTLGTVRPPDPVIIESTEISGMAAFEEVVNLVELASLRDPFKERVLEVIKEHGASVLPT